MNLLGRPWGGIKVWNIFQLGGIVSTEDQQMCERISQGDFLHGTSLYVAKGNVCLRSSFAAQQAKDLALSLLQLRSLLWHRFHPWPRNFPRLQGWKTKQNPDFRDSVRSLRLFAFFFFFCILCMKKTHFPPKLFTALRFVHSPHPTLNLFQFRAAQADAVLLTYITWHYLYQYLKSSVWVMLV